MTLQQLILLALQSSILLTVFGFGLQATPGDVLYLVRRPSLLGRSLFSMLVVMPVVAVALILAFTLRPAVEIVLVALAVSPIPPLLPGRQQKAGGHSSYALGLMAIVGLISIVTVPATMQLLGRFSVRPLEMSSGAIAALVLRTVVLPLVAGIALRALVPALAERVAKPLGLLAKVLLALGALGLLAGVLPSAVALAGNFTILAMVALVVVGLAAGHWLGGPSADHRAVLALSTANRHPAIALAIATVNFPDEPNLAAAIVLYMLVSAIVGIPYTSRQQRSVAATIGA